MHKTQMTISMRKAILIRTHEKTKQQKLIDKTNEQKNEKNENEMKCKTVWSHERNKR